MPSRSLPWIRPSGGASWARAVGATAAVAEAAAVVFMNARRFISYGEVMTLPLQLDDPGIVTLYHSRLDGRITSTFAGPFPLLRRRVGQSAPGASAARPPRRGRLQ